MCGRFEETADFVAAVLASDPDPAQESFGVGGGGERGDKVGDGAGMGHGVFTERVGRRVEGEGSRRGEGREEWESTSRGGKAGIWDVADSNLNSLALNFNAADFAKV